MDIEALVRSVVGEVLQRMRPPQERVLVLGTRDAGGLAAERLGGGADMIFYGEGDGPFDRHVLPRLCCSDMADLAAGRAAGPFMAETLGLLLRGIPVQVLEFEWREHAATAPEALLRLYEGYERQLAAYGLTLLEAPRPECVRSRETVITERAVLDAAESGAGTLLVPNGALVTPLAADTAKTLHLNIIHPGR